MPLAAHFGYPSLARPSLCALEALRWIVSGETMSTPVGRAQRFGQHCCNFLRARRTGFYHGVACRRVFLMYATSASLLICT